MGKVFFKSKIVWYSYLNILILLVPALIITYIKYINTKSVNIYLVTLIILIITYGIYYLKYFMVFDNKLLIVKPFWVKREKVYFKNEIDRIRFYNDKSGNLGGRFMEIKIKNNSKIHNFRIELSKNDRDYFISFLKDKNYTIINEL